MGLGFRSVVRPVSHPSSFIFSLWLLSRKSTSPQLLSSHPSSCHSFPLWYLDAPWPWRQWPGWKTWWLRNPPHSTHPSYLCNLALISQHPEALLSSSEKLDNTAELSKPPEADHMGSGGVMAPCSLVVSMWNSSTYRAFLAPASGWRQHSRLLHCCPIECTFFSFIFHW